MLIIQREEKLSGCEVTFSFPTFCCTALFYFNLSTFIIRFNNLIICNNKNSIWWSIWHLIKYQQTKFFNYLTICSPMLLLVHSFICYLFIWYFLFTPLTFHTFGSFCGEDKILWLFESCSQYHKSSIGLIKNLYKQIPSPNKWKITLISQKLFR